MKQFIEFMPVALFVAIYFYTKDIYLSTGVLMVAIGAQLGIEFATFKRVERKTQVIFWVAILFGGATLLFRNEAFIQWKPTVVNWLFAVALLASQYIGKENLLQKLLGAQLKLPSPVWRNLNFGWSFGFFLAGVLNLVVAWYFSLDFWVSYKLVGGFGLTLLYMIVTIVYLVKGGYIQQEEEGSNQEPTSQPVDVKR